VWDNFKGKIIMKLKKYITSIGFLLNFSMLFGQSITEDAVTVDKKKLQVEGLALYEYYTSSSHTERSWIFPSLLLRYGVNDNVELRFASSYENKKHIHRLDAGELSDLEVGLKVQLLDRENTQLSLINHFLFPSKLSSLDKDNLNASSILVFNQNITNKISLGSSIQYIFENTEERDINYSLMFYFEGTKDFGYYVETYGEMLAGDLISNIDIGLELSIKSNMIWQLSAGTSLQKNYYFASTGIVWQVN
jgi:hypothetical protein